MNGFFITLEGIEGSGKSTQMSLLDEKLSGLGIPHVCTKEPGGTNLGKELRALLLEPNQSGERWCALAELLLFYADRAQHLEELVKPMLLAGHVVISDRSEDSTRAYQGSLGIPGEKLAMMRQMVLNDLRPDLTLLFDADPEAALARANIRNREDDNFAETRFDNEAIGFHKRVRAEFLKIALEEPGRVQVINANQSHGSVAKDVWSAVAPKLAVAGFPILPTEKPYILQNH
ncbi:MAG: dTMP kinase [Holophagaceae bacterium]|nr:dTMP kinase [Holophagaceae bacterium]